MNIYWQGYFLFYSFFIITGILFSGLHLVDDHECFTFAAILEEKGFFEINMVAWYICNIAEVALALLFFYIFAREMKTNVFFSVMFAVLILTGGQSAV